MESEVKPNWKRWPMTHHSSTQLEIELVIIHDS